MVPLLAPAACETLPVTCSPPTTDTVTCSVSAIAASPGSDTSSIKEPSLQVFLLPHAPAIPSASSASSPAVRRREKALVLLTVTLPFRDRWSPTWPGPDPCCPRRRRRCRRPLRPGSPHRRPPRTSVA